MTTSRQHEIREFLASRRARITPEKAGVTTYGDDRRVPGLRREEVAMLAGVSVDYYTRLERGKIGGASESVLEAIARALQLDDDERTHLYDLARSVVTTPRSRSRAKAKPGLAPSVQRVLDAMDVPAVVQNGRLDLLAANVLGRALYRDVYDNPGQPPNLARFIFLDPRAVDFYVDHDKAKDLTVASLRAAAGRDPLDRELTRLIGELSTLSPAFSALWAKHDVRQHRAGRKVLNHPVVGLLDVAFDDFALPTDPDVAICTFTADPGTPTADALMLLASWAATRPATSDEVAGQGSDEVRPGTPPG